MMGRSPRCYISSFVKIGQPVLEKKIFEGFLACMGVAAANKLSGGSTKNLALIGQAVSVEKMFENVNGRTDDGRTTDGRTDDGPWVSYKLTGEPSAQVS